MEKGKLFVVSGPSGVGKGTVIDEVLKDESLNLQKSVNVTTRKPREGDKGNPHYIFVDKKTFNKMYNKELILEKDEHFGDLYGASKIVLDKIIERGKNALLEVDALSGPGIKEKISDAVLIFIYAGKEYLEKRLNRRGDDAKKRIKEKLERADKELKMKDRYDYNVLNPEGEPEKAVEEVKKIIKQKINK